MREYALNNFYDFSFLTTRESNLVQYRYKSVKKQSALLNTGFV